MRFSSLVERVGGEGAAAWDIHTQAVERRSKGEDVILLSVGDPDFDTPAPIVAAAIESLHRGRTHYMPVIGEPALRQAIALSHQRASGQVEAVIRDGAAGLAEVERERWTVVLP